MKYSKYRKRNEKQNSKYYLTQQHYLFFSCNKFNLKMFVKVKTSKD